MPMATIPTTSSRSAISSPPPARTIVRPLRVLLISTYELGRQPFGLASPAAWLRQAGHHVHCADLAVSELPEADAARADVIGFYVPMHTATRLALPLIRRVRELNQTAHVCAFGLYAVVNARHFRDLGVETLLAGEFEAGLATLCDRLAAAGVDPGSPSSHLEGHAATSIEKLDFLLPDRRDLPGLDAYARLRVGEEERAVGYVEASRGCKHRCRHCPVVPVYDGRFRIVPRDVVLDDIRQQVDAGARHITFGDPDFFNGIGHAVALIEGLHAEFPDLTYDVTVKVEHLLEHRDRLALLRDTGCAFVTSAVEAVDDEVLRILDKGHTRADFIETARLCAGVGLALSPTFVPFTPWTAPASYLDLLRLLAELDLVDHVASVQLAIRLLIPEGARLLELEQTQTFLQPFEPEMLGYPWKHPDPRMDELHTQVSDAIRSQHPTHSRREAFAAVWTLAHQALGEQAPALPEPVAAAATIPYLTEPWYC